MACVGMLTKSVMAVVLFVKPDHERVHTFMHNFTVQLE